MTPSQIIARAKKKFNVSDTVYPNSDAIDDLNVIKDDFFGAIVSKLNEDYNWDTWTTGMVAGQSEYTVPEAARDALGAMKIRGVALSFDGKSYDSTTIPIYYEADLVTFDSLEKEWNYYLAYQDPSKPMYVLSENSIFIAPLPKNDISNGIKLRGIKNIVDYTLSSTEADMKIPYNWHEILVDGLGEYCYSRKAMSAEATAQRGEYERRRDVACERLSDRVVAPFVNEFPSNSQYQPDAYTGDFPTF